MSSPASRRLWAERLRPRALPAWLSRQTLVIGLAVALGATLDVTGALHVYGLGGLMGQKLALGAALIIVGLAAGLVAVTAQSPAECADQPALTASPLAECANQPAAGMRRLGALLMLLAWLATARSFLVFLAPGAGPLEQLWFVIGACALSIAVARPPRAWALLLLATTLGLGARVLSMRHVQIDPTDGDMIPLVQQALANLLAGKNPYTIYAMPWELPLTYLPATWLAYLPAHLLGLDIRLTNALAELTVGAAILWLTRGGDGRARGMGAILWAWVLLQPSGLSWSLTTTAPIWWAILAVTLALALSRRRRAALGLGLGAAASPFAAVAWPFVLIYLVRRGGWRGALLVGAAAALCGAALIVPFLLWDPDMFALGVWRWFNDLDLFPRLRWRLDNTWASMVGFGGIFWRRNLESLLKPIQAAVVGYLLLRFWRATPTPARLAATVAAASLLFTAFNPVLWPYLYNHGLVAALLAVAAMERAA